MNATDPYLNLSTELLAAGGNRLQDECNYKYTNGVSVGEIAETTGCQLKCKTVYHSVFPQHNKERGEESIQLVRYKHTLIFQK